MPDDQLLQATRRRRGESNENAVSDNQEFWAPNLASYGYDSRAASVRIIAPPGVPAAGTRFEIRVPGADVHPMLAFSAIFGLGLRGIENKLALPYGPIGAPGVTRESLPKLATTLEPATARFMAPGSIARECFGDMFVDHYGGTREHEVEVFKRAVTTWERECGVQMRGGTLTGSVGGSRTLPRANLNCASPRGAQRMRQCMRCAAERDRHGTRRVSATEQVQT